MEARDIRTARQLAGLTLEDLGRVVGVSAPTISRVERGQRVLAQDTLMRVFSALEHALTRRAEEAAASREDHRDPAGRGRQ